MSLQIKNLCEQVKSRPEGLTIKLNGIDDVAAFKEQLEVEGVFAEDVMVNGVPALILSTSIETESNSEVSIPEGPTPLEQALDKIKELESKVLKKETELEELNLSLSSFPKLPPPPAFALVATTIELEKIISDSKINPQHFYFLANLLISKAFKSDGNGKPGVHKFEVKVSRLFTFLENMRNKFLSPHHMEVKVELRCTSLFMYLHAKYPGAFFSITPYESKEQVVEVRFFGFKK